MLRIRLTRVGKKKQPHYRVVVADIEAKRDGRIVERIGYYNPLTEPATYEIEEERALHWLSVGAQPTDVVRQLLKKQGTYARLRRLHAGEALADLAAEVDGPTEQPAAAAGAVQEVVSDVVEQVSETAEDVAEAVGDAVEDVTDAISDAVTDTLEEEE